MPSFDAGMGGLRSLSHRFAQMRTTDLYPYLRELDIAALRRILREAPRETEDDRYRLTVVQAELELREALDAETEGARRDPPPA